MEYENKEAKKFVQWFLLCSVIILLLTGTVTTLVVRNYRARENEAVTAMLGIVLKNDGSDTEESRQEKISECMRMLEHPHAYQKSHQKEIKEAEKILQSYGISEAEPVIAGTKTMERRILLGTLGGVLLAELAAGGLFFIYQKRRSRKLAELSDYMEEIVRGHYELAFFQLLCTLHLVRLIIQYYNPVFLFKVSIYNSLNKNHFLFLTSWLTGKSRIDLICIPPQYKRLLSP